MQLMNDHKNINLPRFGSSQTGTDFSFLRREGMEYIEQLSKNLWTDYNLHDPGVTILEILAYAITDLGQRIDLPMEDLLAFKSGDDEHPTLKEFFEAQEILPGKPVSELDYRKLFIDIDGVNNCWIRPYPKKIYADCKTKQLSYNKDDFKDRLPAHIKETCLQGLYSMLVDYDGDLSDEEKALVQQKITEKYHANRNLCEDLVSVKEVGQYEIAVCCSIELTPDAVPEKTHAQILAAIGQYFAPEMRFYSLREMQQRGYPTDQIFEGPTLTHGFLDSKELAASSLREEVRLSDLIQIIMNIEGVQLIKDIIIKDCADKNDEGKSWNICIPGDSKPVRCNKCSSFSYFKDVLPIGLKQSKVNEYSETLRDENHRDTSIDDHQLEIPVGTYRNIGETTTIQNDFPETYGIGFNGLPPQADEARRAQAKQLKGYLLFFDQMLATYFAHLEQVKELFAVDNRLKRTYFTQAVADVPGLADLVSDYSLDDNDALSEQLLGSLDHAVERQNKVLDHLIARFAERFGEYAFLMNQLYGSYADELVLRDKRSFLKDYDRSSQSRGSAFNYYRQPPSNLWDTDNVSGFQKRVAKLTGITNYNRRNLCDSFLEVYTLSGQYRWRFRDINRKIVLTSTEPYPNVFSAEQEIYLVLIRIMETSGKQIDEAFAKDENGRLKELADGTIIGNLLVRRSDAGRYSFDVINPGKAGKDWIIARQYSYYKTPETFKASIMSFIRFMKDEFSEEGMFVVENILLRPSSDDVDTDLFLPAGCEGCEEDGCAFDPYSYRVTIVLPGWTMRFWDMDYRQFLENLIRKELPAHILPCICWVGYRKNDPLVDDETADGARRNDMEYFENAYKQFLLNKTETGQVKEKEHITELNDAINSLNTIYHSGRLMDCTGENLSGKIILGRSNIGNP